MYHTTKVNIILCMHAAKTFLTVFPRKFIPSKYTRYTVLYLTELLLRILSIARNDDPPSPMYRLEICDL